MGIPTLVSNRTKPPDSIFDYLFFCCAVFGIESWPIYLQKVKIFSNQTATRKSKMPNVWFAIWDAMIREGIGYIPEYSWSPRERVRRDQDHHTCKSVTCWMALWKGSEINSIIFGSPISKKFTQIEGLKRAGFMLLWHLDVQLCNSSTNFHLPNPSSMQ